MPYTVLKDIMFKMEDAIREDGQKVEIIRIEYDQPKFAHKILAKIIDVIIFMFLAIALFIATRAVVQNSGMYQRNDRMYKTIELESGLFINANGSSNNFYTFGDDVQVLTTYLPKQNMLTYKDILRRCDYEIKNFINYLKPINPLASATCEKAYELRRLGLIGGVPGHERYFVQRADYDTEHEEYYEFSKDDNLIIPLNVSGMPYYSFMTYFEVFYKPFIEDDLIDNYLVTYVPALSEGIKNEGRYILFIEFPVAYITAAILTFYVPTLCFRRGRKTLGRALYRIGYVDGKYFSPGFWRNLARFAILLVAELILSLVTFGIPFFISFTMMVVTKRKQNFPDYLLGLVEIDVSKQKIYYNKIDALSQKARVDKKAPDFKLPSI